jgi:hypothetical protein
VRRRPLIANNLTSRDLARVKEYDRENGTLAWLEQQAARHELPTGGNLESGKGGSGKGRAQNDAVPQQKKYPGALSVTVHKVYKQSYS